MASGGQSRIKAGKIAAERVYGDSAPLRAGERSGLDRAARL